MNSGEIGLQIRIRSSADMGAVENATQSLNSLGGETMTANLAMRQLWQSTHGFQLIAHGLARGDIPGLIQAMHGFRIEAHILGPMLAEIGGFAAGMAAPVVLAMKLMSDKTKELRGDIAAMYEEGKIGAETYKLEIERLDKASAKMAEDLKSDWDGVVKGIEAHNAAIKEAEERGAALDKAAEARMTAERKRDEQIALGKAKTPEEAAAITAGFKMKDEQAADQKKITDLENQMLRAKQAVADTADQERALADERDKKLRAVEEKERDAQAKIAAAGGTMKQFGAGGGVPAALPMEPALGPLGLLAPLASMLLSDVGGGSNKMLVKQQAEARAAAEDAKKFKETVSKEGEAEPASLTERRKKAEIDLATMEENVKAEEATLIGERAARQNEIRKMTAPLAAEANAAAQKVSLDQEALDALKEKAERSHDIGAFAAEIAAATKTLEKDTAAAAAAQEKYQRTLDTLNASAKDAEKSLVTHTSLLQQLLTEMRGTRAALERIPIGGGSTKTGMIGGPSALAPKDLGEAMSIFFDASGSKDAVTFDLFKQATLATQQMILQMRDLAGP